MSRPVGCGPRKISDKEACLVYGKLRGNDAATFEADKDGESFVLHFHCGDQCNMSQVSASIWENLKKTSQGRDGASYKVTLKSIKGNIPEDFASQVKVCAAPNNVCS